MNKTKQNTKKRSPLFSAFFICGLASLFYVYDFLLRVMPSAMTDDLMLHFKIDAPGLGIMLAMFYFAYAPMQIPAGMLFDRFGAKKLLTITITICSIGTLIFGITDSVLIAGIGRFLIGLSSAFAFLGALILATRWLPHKYFTLFVGLVQLLGCAGSIAGEQPIAIAVKHFGWKQTNFTVAMLGFLLAGLYWFLLHDFPKGVAREKIKNNKFKLSRELQRLVKVYKNKQNLWVGLYAFAIWAPVTVFPVLWGVPFLIARYKINTISATSMMSLMWIGIGIGCPLIGWWSDHINKRRLPLFLSALFGLFFTLIILYFNNISLLTMDILLFALGVSIGSMVVTFGCIKDNNHISVIGTADGLNNMLILVGGIILQPLVGIILKLFWDGKTLNNVPIYSNHNYQIALGVLPLCFLLSLFSVLFIKETNCQFKKT